MFVIISVCVAADRPAVDAAAAVTMAMVQPSYLTLLYGATTGTDHDLRLVDDSFDLVQQQDAAMATEADARPAVAPATR